MYNLHFESAFLDRLDDALFDLDKSRWVSVKRRDGIDGLSEPQFFDAISLWPIGHDSERESWGEGGAN